MKVKEADKKRKTRGCERMAEMMKAFCDSEGGAIDCHSFMRKMMGVGAKEEAKKAKRTS